MILLGDTILDNFFSGDPRAVKTAIFVSLFLVIIRNSGPGTTSRSMTYNGFLLIMGSQLHTNAFCILSLTSLFFIYPWICGTPCSRRNNCF